MSRPDNFNDIMPTAILTAYPKTLTDIPYAKEMMQYLSANIAIGSELIVDRLAPEIEARYKLMNRLLKEQEIGQILEFAAGYSTRGLTFANDGYTYVELDLEEVSDNKKAALRSFTPIPRNLHVVAGSALNPDDISKCEKHFDRQAVAVIHEGLLRYLNFEEKKKVAENARDILSYYGGVWITCDVTPRKFIANQDKNLAGFNTNLSNLTNRNNADWRFDDIDHVRSFLGKVGFDVEVHDFNEVQDELLSPEKLGLNKDETARLLDGAIVAVMRLKERLDKDAK